MAAPCTDHLFLTGDIAHAARYFPENCRHSEVADPYRWSATTVGYILDRQEYLGHPVLGKSICENFKTKDVYKRQEKKSDLDKITFTSDTLRKYFPRSYTPQRMQETIIKLLEQWQRKRQQQHDR